MIREVDDLRVSVASPMVIWMCRLGTGARYVPTLNATGMSEIVEPNNFASVIAETAMQYRISALCQLGDTESNRRLNNVIT